MPRTIDLSQSYFKDHLPVCVKCWHYQPNKALDPFDNETRCAIYGAIPEEYLLMSDTCDKLRIMRGKEFIDVGRPPTMHERMAADGIPDERIISDTVEIELQDGKARLSLSDLEQIKLELIEILKQKSPAEEYAPLLKNISGYCYLTIRQDVLDTVGIGAWRLFVHGKVAYFGCEEIKETLYGHEENPRAPKSIYTAPLVFANGHWKIIDVYTTKFNAASSESAEIKLFDGKAHISLKDLEQIKLELIELFKLRPGYYASDIQEIERSAVTINAKEESDDPRSHFEQYEEEFRYIGIGPWRIVINDKDDAWLPASTPLLERCQSGPERFIYIVPLTFENGQWMASNMWSLQSAAHRFDYKTQTSEQP
jgi:hypothetical protein